MGRSKTSPEAIEFAKRVADAIEYRKGGLQWEEIARLCGWNSPQAAHKAVGAALKKHVTESIDELRAVDELRLQEMFFAIYPKAAAGSLGSVTRALAIMKRRARLLGYDAPLKVAQTDSKGKDKPTNVVFYIPDNGREGNSDGTQN